MKYRTILGMTQLESRDNPNGGMGEMPGMTPPPPGGGGPAFTDPNGGSGIDPGQGPIGGGSTQGAPPPP